MNRNHSFQFQRRHHHDHISLRGSTNRSLAKLPNRSDDRRIRPHAPAHDHVADLEHVRLSAAPNPDRILLRFPHAPSVQKPFVQFYLYAPQTGRDEAEAVGKHFAEQTQNDSGAGMQVRNVRNDRV